MAVTTERKRRRKSSLVKSTLGIFILALVIGAVAAALAGLYIKIRGDAYLESLKGQEKQEAVVVVATSNLPKGTIIGNNNMAARSIPVDYIHEGAVSPDQFESFTGKVLIQPMSQGTPLLRAFMDVEFGDDFSDTIKAGRRAITMQVDDLNAIGGLARPGNRIDIFVLLPPGVTDPEDERDMVLPVLQDVLVLTTGQVAYDDYREKVLLGGRSPESGFSNITVDVSPREAALLSQAIDKGSIITLLRNRDDRGLASFGQILPVDLVTHAASVARQYQSENKLIVTEDGVVMTSDGQVQEGVTVTKDGFLVDRDGNVMTKDGVIIEGVTLNDNGEVVTADGRVLKESEVVVNSDGSVGIVKSETVAGVTASKIEGFTEGLVQNADGTFTTADGKQVTLTDDGFYVTEDGTVLTRDGYVLEGVSVNDKGEVVSADGTVLKSDDVVINEDGSVDVRATGTEVVSLEPVAGVSATKVEGFAEGLTQNADGSFTTADGNQVTLTKDGFYVTEDGTVLTKDGYVLEGVAVNENGEVVTVDGTILKADDVVVNEDGSVAVQTVRTVPVVEELQGVSGVEGELSRLADEPTASLENLIEFIAGGISEGGKATVTNLPVLKD